MYLLLKIHPALAQIMVNQNHSCHNRIKNPSETVLSVKEKEKITIIEGNRYRNDKRNVYGK